jgi:hypothetical protein
MSIVALKNKARAMWGSHSQGTEGFSLNGKTRFTSGVGSNLGKSVTRTPFKGMEPKGHGGGQRCRVGGIQARVNHCNGPAYPRVVSNSGTCFTRQYLVKTSVVNTSGMIQGRFMGILHGTYPRTWVQAQASVGHGEKLVAAAAAAVVASSIGCGSAKKTVSSGEGSIEATRGCGPYSHTPSHTTEEHLLRVTAQCKSQECDKVHFPTPITSTGCRSYYATWQEAQAAGLLCATYHG